MSAASIHARLPNERYWRDCQTALVHVCNVAEGVYRSWAVDDLGGEANRAIFI